MTELRRKLLANTRFLAVAVLLCGMAYVTWQTQEDVREANDDRAALRARVGRLEVELAKKDAEVRRLTALLVKNGIDPPADADGEADCQREPIGCAGFIGPASEPVQRLRAAVAQPEPLSEALAEPHSPADAEPHELTPVPPAAADALRATGRGMTGQDGSGRTRAWRCDRCTRLSVRSDVGAAPPHCDHCGGPVAEIALTRTEKPS